jgi:hypothetical protein
VGQLPNWMAYPDVDRVDWLNDVFVTYASLLLA